MFIPTNKDLKIALGKANAIANEYKKKSQKPNEFERSMDDFIRIVRSVSGKEIHINKFLTVQGDNSIKALFFAMADQYRIWYQPDMNPCWTRFVVCKEVFHVILDAPTYQTMHVYKHVEEQSLPLPEEAFHSYPAGSSEEMAKVAAVEFLFPYSERLGCRNGKKTSADFLKLAEKYKIPQVYVEIYLSDPWMDFLGPLSESLN